MIKSGHTQVAVLWLEAWLKGSNIGIGLSIDLENIGTPTILIKSMVKLAANRSEASASGSDDCDEQG